MYRLLIAKQRVSAEAVLLKSYSDLFVKLTQIANDIRIEFNEKGDDSIYIARNYPKEWKDYYKGMTSISSSVIHKKGTAYYKAINELFQKHCPKSLWRLHEATLLGSFHVGAELDMCIALSFDSMYYKVPPKEHLNLRLRIKYPVTRDGKFSEGMVLR